MVTVITSPLLYLLSFILNYCVYCRYFRITMVPSPLPWLLSLLLHHYIYYCCGYNHCFTITMVTIVTSPLPRLLPLIHHYYGYHRYFIITMVTVVTTINMVTIVTSPLLWLQSLLHCYCGYHCYFTITTLTSQLLQLTRSHVTIVNTPIKKQLQMQLYQQEGSNPAIYHGTSKVDTPTVSSFSDRKIPYPLHPTPRVQA